MTALDLEQKLLFSSYHQYAFAMSTLTNGEIQNSSFGELSERPAGQKYINTVPATICTE
jgi:hypothetical protein